MILCDVGNTNYKFLINNEKFTYFMHEALPVIHEKVYYISVNETALLKLKHAYDDIIDLEPHINFTTLYEGMGLDRKVVCRGFEDAVIVDAGSAITVDIMENSQHQGGFILAGLQSLKDNYANISIKLDIDFNLKVNLDKIPLNTQDAISYAIIKSIISPIIEVAKDKKVIFTGGDGELLSSFIQNSIYKENLIFDNMEGIINANNCIT